jgi:peptidoglycan/LPS O-acetylase OafA/YrhL
MVDVLASAFFVANVRFIDVGTDYFARTSPPSPVQQFWSLAVEEQYYVVWPLLLALLLGVSLRSGGKGSGARHPGRLAVAITAIVVASFAWSVHETRTDPTVAYFSTLGRVWELGLGAALAIGAARLSDLPAAARTTAGWVGLLMIVAAAIAYSDSTRFPGVAAVLPVIGTLLLIAAAIGAAPGRFGAGRLLAIRPLRYVGDRSYAFYLWHWPVLVIVAQHEGHAMSVRANLVLLGFAFLLSIISYRLVEDPIRRGRLRLRIRRPRFLARRESLADGLLLWPLVTGAVVIVAGICLFAIDREESSARSQVDASATGPLRAAREGAPLPAVTAAVAAAEAGTAIPDGLVPTPGDLLEDRFYFAPGCAPQPEETEARVCPLGEPGADRTLVVFGDSKAQMWTSAILAMADRDGWRVLPIAKSSCTPSGWAGWAAEEVGPECRRWYDWAIAKVAAIAPDATIVAGNYDEATADADYNAASAEGLRMAEAAIAPHTGRLVVVADVPGLDAEPVDCLLAPDADLGTCSTTMTSFQVEATEQVAADAEANGVGLIDPTGWACADLVCPMVVGTTISYTDRGHLSETYVDRLRGLFRAGFRDALRGQP